MSDGGIELTNCAGIPDESKLAAVQHVRRKIHGDIEEIWFQGNHTLIVERYDKPTMSLPFAFTRNAHVGL